MQSRRRFLGGLAAAPALLRAAPTRPNVLLLTVDDMNWDAPGVFGNRIPGITPHIDRLAGQGIRFLRAHNTVAVCQPNRSVLMTGRYPHRNGAEGFQPIRPDVPTLQERLRQAGYRNGILAKTEHLAPPEKFCWDTLVRGAELGQGRDPSLYHQHATRFFQQAKAAGRPFFLMANSQDPHRPFAGSEQERASAARRGRREAPPKPVRRRIEPAEVSVPGFLPDLPEVRLEVAEYYTSVHRADQTVGAVLAALDESGLAPNTLVLFLSDNGMAFPFAKANCYYNSTRTPWIVRWPGKVRPGTIDARHFLSTIDFLPTVLDACGLPPMEGIDGTSFTPLLAGRRQPRERLVTVFHETSARRRYEMRSVLEGRFGYIFNAWAGGGTQYKNESQNGRTFRALERAAATDPAIAARVRHFEYRVPEELYDYQADPNALRNLIADPAYRTETAHLRQALRDWMKRTADPLQAVFQAGTAATRAT